MTIGAGEAASVGDGIVHGSGMPVGAVASDGDGTTHGAGTVGAGEAAGAGTLAGAGMQDGVTPDGADSIVPIIAHLTSTTMVSTDTTTIDMLLTVVDVVITGIAESPPIQFEEDLILEPGLVLALVVTGVIAADPI